MNFIERPDLPHALVAALTSSDKGYHSEVEKYFSSLKEKHDYAISVTTMPGPPRIRELMRRHDGEIYSDPEDLLWVMKGQIIHGLIEKNSRKCDIAERRMGITVPLMINEEKVRVHMHGQIDLYEPEEKTLYDFKYVSPTTMLYPTKQEYIFQLNALSVLANLSAGIEVERLCNVYIMKDWNKRDYVKLKNRGYPAKTIIVKEQPMWEVIDTKRAMAKNVRAHYTAQLTEDNELPFCTKDQRWQGNSIWKLYTRTKPKRKGDVGHMSTKAKFSSDVYEEVLDYIKQELMGVHPNDYNVKEIPSEPKRCSGWCSVAGLCNQRQDELRKIQEQTNK